MKRIGQKIYNSTAWTQIRNAYMDKVNWRCERCGGLATICHHREYITAANVNRAEVTLNFENLEALCQECHNREHKHFSRAEGAAIFDAAGDMVGLVESAELARFRESVSKFEPPHAE